MAGGEVYDVVFTSELLCRPARSHWRWTSQQPAAIHPFIRPFVAWGTREGAQLMHRVLRVINAPIETLQQEQPTFIHTVRSI